MLRAKRNHVHKIDVDIRYGSLDNAIKSLREAKAQAKKLKLSDVRLDIETYDDYGATGISCQVSGERPETDEEYQIRLEQEEQSRNMRRHAYENLKKEFENEEK